MRIARPLMVALVAGCSLLGCGSDDSASGTDTTTSSSSITKTQHSPQTGATQDSPSEPSGRLSDHEYALMSHAVRRAGEAKHVRGLGATVRKLEAACAELRDAPTPLLRESEKNCLSQAALLRTLVSFPRKVKVCTHRVDPKCLGQPVDEISKRAREGVAAGMAANRAADARDIRGGCREVVGVPDRDLRSLPRLASAADVFNRAIVTRDAVRLNSASRRFQSALNDLGGGPDQNLVKLVRDCR